MDILIARLIHITTGVIWAGAAVIFARFIEPAASSTGEHGQVFMRDLERRGVTNFITLVAVTGILSGAYLYWRVSDGLRPAWITSGPGIAITVGAITALIAFSFGPLFYIPLGRRMAEIGQAIAAKGDPPTPAQREEMGRIVARLGQLGVWSAVLLTITVLCMAAARYIGVG